MTEWRTIKNASSGEVVLARAKWCKSFLCRFRGLMFRRSVPENEGLLFVFHRESLSETSIHMFFVPFSIAAVWLNNEGRVVGAKLAKPWRPFYKADAPARYLIEAAPDLLQRVKLGDVLQFNEPAE